MLRQHFFCFECNRHRRIDFRTPRMEAGTLFVLTGNTFDIKIQYSHFPYFSFCNIKACPTSLEFMVEFLTIHGIGKDARMSSLCSYILELSLASHTNLKYPPSVIAASSMVLAFYCLRKSGIHSLWPEELANITGLELDKDLVQCSVELSQDIENVRHTTQRLDMIQRRNSKPCRHNIAEISIPILTSKTTLTDCEERLRSRTIIPSN